MARQLNLFTIPPGAAFADELARGAIARFADESDPLALSRLLVLVPTRRAIGAVSEAFARVSRAGVTVLPRVRALGDWDDDPDLVGESEDFPGETPDLPPPISPLRRELLLAKLIHRWSQRTEATEGQRSYGTPPALALVLARDLARLLDQAAAEGLDWQRLSDLVPDDYSKHWDLTLNFLKIVTENWPLLLEGEGKSDPVIHRDAALRKAAALWSTKPPPHPVIAAGSTGSVPATATLLKAIAGLQQGAVVLPGIDLATPDAEWETLPPGHPQHGMRDLITKFGATRRDVQAWTDAPGNAPRAALLREALRPAEATAEWRAVIAEHKATLTAGLEGLKTVSTRTPAEEAQVIALALRRVADTPKMTAALVTPNRVLARRVAAELKRWDIDIDDSAGMPLSKSVPGRFLSLIAEVAAERLAPVPLLALLKHPLTTLGYSERGDLRSLAEKFEKKVLRGPRPSPGFSGLRDAFDDFDRRAFGELVDELETGLGDFASDDAHEELSLETLIERHRGAAERIAVATRGEDSIWDHDAGRVAADLFSSLATAAPGCGIEISRRDYVDFIRAIMDQASVRPRFGRHPRLHIWGPLEARLQQSDLTILGGLNEGAWPPLADPGPWLNRPMRKTLELSQPERRVGLSAHDFAQAACAKQTLLTRSEKDSGSPTTASRWLTRLAIVADGAGLREKLGDEELVGIARRIDRPAQERPIAPPRPTPPLAARPRDLWVTDIERWIRDPYALYARSILKLKKLDPLDDTPAAAERGMVIHDALDDFTKLFPGELPEGDIPYNVLLEEGRKAFGKMLSRPGVAAFWWPRFERMARWLIAFERERRSEGATVASELQGEYDLASQNFKLRARADRIDLWPDGTASIIDYKTGQAPTSKQVVTNLAPQIPLEAAIALAGGFPDRRPASIREMLIIQLKGDTAGGKAIPIKPDNETLDEVATKAISGLSRLIKSYDDPTMPYLARLRVLLQFARIEGDYDHLARIKEWSSGDDDA
ncbi:MAG: double-strand break repair protein AddB [Alphaproteobacteria bacterium]|nr:double-strand break repair protein AddB [Alphaproteobacteria bacterium]